jgi:hypothetical protein
MRACTAISVAAIGIVPPHARGEIAQYGFALRTGCDHVGHFWSPDPILVWLSSLGCAANAARDQINPAGQGWPSAVPHASICP